MMKALKKKRKGGFTLIELIVVIAILGILAAIAIPRFTTVTGTAAAEAEAATIRTVNSAYQVYLAGGSTGAWPADYVNGAIVNATDNTKIDVPIKGGSVTLTLNATTKTWGK